MTALDTKQTIVVGISSRALFAMDDVHQMYLNDGIDKFREFQIANEDVPLDPGPAFHLVKKLLNLKDDDGTRHVEVILLSRNTSDTGLRIFNSIEHHGLEITRAAFAGGDSPYRYAESFGVHLFLSPDADDVKLALDSGIAAATILPSVLSNIDSPQLRIAFDGDAVLFSDESERIFKANGLKAFSDNETDKVDTPLEGGPFKAFLQMIHRIQKLSPPDQSLIRTALVTARGAPSHKRVINTLRAWDVRIDEAMFLGGMDKGPVLKAFGADIFFDDQKKHCESAQQHVATGHVPNGVANIAVAKVIIGQVEEPAIAAKSVKF